MSTWPRHLTHTQTHTNKLSLPHANTPIGGLAGGELKLVADSGTPAAGANGTDMNKHFAAWISTFWNNETEAAFVIPFHKPSGVPNLLHEQWRPASTQLSNIQASQVCHLHDQNVQATSTRSPSSTEMIHTHGVHHSTQQQPLGAGTNNTRSDHQSLDEHAGLKHWPPIKHNRSSRRDSKRRTQEARSTQ
jgi:hypothetical protein